PGLLLVLAGPATDPGAVRRLVQFVSLQKWPLLILLLDDHRDPVADWADLDPHVTRSLAWPRDAEELTRAIQERLGKHRESHRPAGDSLEDLLRRRMLTQTPSLLPLVERV